jgi:hypothetical protein
MPTYRELTHYQKVIVAQKEAVVKTMSDENFQGGV